MPSVEPELGDRVNRPSGCVVIPAKAGIQNRYRLGLIAGPARLDPRLRGDDDGLRSVLLLPRIGEQHRRGDRG